MLKSGSVYAAEINWTSFSTQHAGREFLTGLPQPSVHLEEASFRPCEHVNGTHTCEIAVYSNSGSESDETAIQRMTAFLLFKTGKRSIFVPNDIFQLQSIDFKNLTLTGICLMPHNAIQHQPPGNFTISRPPGANVVIKLSFLVDQVDSHNTSQGHCMMF